MSVSTIQTADFPAFREHGLLLHTCCGPCSEYPGEELLAAGVRPLMYYFNPNIHPEAEWQHRYEALAELCAKRQLSLRVDPSYDEETWAGLGTSPERCRFCYRVRMEAAAKEAQAQNLLYFTTTLLISPYQNREQILVAGEQAAQRYGRIFWQADWRDHFRYGENRAREDGLYRQKYCGCIVSLSESKFKAKTLQQQADFVPQADTPGVRKVHYAPSEYDRGNLAST